MFLGSGGKVRSDFHDEGGRGGKVKSDFSWQGGKGVSKKVIFDDKGGGGVQTPLKKRDIICEQPLIREYNLKPWQHTPASRGTSVLPTTELYLAVWLLHISSDLI